MSPWPDTKGTDLKRALKDRDYWKEQATRLRAETARLRERLSLLEHSRSLEQGDALDRAARAEAESGRLCEALTDVLDNDCYHPENLPDGDERCRRARAVLAGEEVK